MALTEFYRYLDKHPSSRYIPPGSTPVGRYLTEKEKFTITNIICSCLDQKILEKDIEISIAGSLSQIKSGIRHKKYCLFDTYSDEYYISDIDLGIISKILFNIIASKWPKLVHKIGRFAGRATYNINYRKIDSSMILVPEFLKKMCSHLERNIYAGERRSANLMILKYRLDDENPERDIIYKA